MKTPRPLPAHRVGARPLALYVRSRGIPTTLAILAGAALLTAWAANRPDAYLDPYRRVPLIALAPLLASAAVVGGLHTHSPELDSTAVRPWWPRRLGHLLALSAVAALLLALSVPGHSQQFGAAAMVRNTLGGIGITTVAATVLGARLSWMPTTLYFSAVYLSASSPRVSNATVLAWSMQPGPQRGAWLVGLALFVAGSALYATLGARPEGSRV